MAKTPAQEMTDMFMRGINWDVVDALPDDEPVKLAKAEFTHLQGVDGDEEAGTVTYWYDVYWQGQTPGEDEPHREFSTVVKV